ncbi:hypothetical protein FAIPA1_540002 [Frankia sp. AiPs1]
MYFSGVNGRGRWDTVDQIVSTPPAATKEQAVTDDADQVWFITGVGRSAVRSPATRAGSATRC